MLLMVMMMGTMVMEAVVRLMTWRYLQQVLQEKTMLEPPLMMSIDDHDDDAVDDVDAVMLLVMMMVLMTIG